MIGELIAGVLYNFSLVMFVLAVLITIALSRPWQGVAKSKLYEELFRWVSLLAVGFVGVYAAVTHIFFPHISAAEIGWQTSPFQYEVGVADLAVGILGATAFRAGLGFRTAATIAATVSLGGDAIGHVHQMIVAHNFAPGNAGPWFWTDVLVPVVMVLFLIVLLRQEKLAEQVSRERADFRVPTAS